MKTNPNPTKDLQESGFALVISLSLMVLLTVLAVGLLSLSSIALRSSGQSEAMQVAKANARMALMLAWGDLQKASGPDQSITATSSILPGKVAESKWTGVWSTVPDATGDEPRWMVSGKDPNPDSTGSSATMVLVDSGSDEDKVNVPAVPIEATGRSMPGRFAWWIGDEGTKARVDVEEPTDPAGSERERLARSQSPGEPGLACLGKAWEKIQGDGAFDRNLLVSVPTAALATEDPEVPRDHFSEVTSGGYGVPVNVVDGGMKADLSQIFDRTQNAKKYSKRYLGGTPAAMSFNGANIFQFSINDPKKFFLSETTSKNGSLPVGPNWGTLWNYASLWQNATGHQFPLIGANPVPWTDLRYRDWLPYTNHNAGTYQNDLQHTNSPLQPVVSLLQMGFRLKAKPAPPAANGQKMFVAQLELKPVFGLWNPYNVTLKAAPYSLQWALYPYLRFNYAKRSGNGKYTDGRLTELWLRERWTSGGGSIPTPEKQTDGKYFSVETDTVDLQPGEFRLFSVTDQIQIQAGKTYRLKSGWSERGAFVVDLADNNGATRLVPSGYRAWFGDIYLQDTQSPNTTKRFPLLDSKRTASTWFTLKSGNNVMLRATELWNGDPGSKVPVPEPVVSGSSGGLDTTKETFLIDDLVGENVVAHIATWSFFSRTSTQMAEENQRLRGWIDSNPRAFVTNPAWDGSRVAGSAREGWHLTSQWMGGTHDPAPRGQVGDGLGGNRGLIGEGGRAEPEPQVDPQNLSRYRGYGGPSNTPTGQPNVVVYDVPRTPLVSVGQFQHASLSRYNFEPGFVVGNSHANVRIPLETTVARNLAGVKGLDVVDTSHEVNARLWDRYFFSTLGVDYVAGSGSSLDKVFDFGKLASGETSLPNPRMAFQPASGDTNFDKIISDAGDRVPEAIASRVLVKGAFNVNSTSPGAWKAMLSTMGSGDLPVLNAKTGKVSWEAPDGVRFNRFGHVLSKDPFVAGGGGEDPGFWQGWRQLSSSELDELANEIVSEVKARGPFHSMADFVNRDPKSSEVDHQRKGPLQAAIDRTINAGLGSDIGSPSQKPPGTAFSNAITGECSAAGAASYLLQGDVLQSLAPVLQVRSDYFRIRACGEAHDDHGKVVARASCEAFVQRVPDYLDRSDPAHLQTAELQSEVNQRFGRRYEIVSFRWLHGAGV